MTGCTLAAIWCLSITYTMLTPDGVRPGIQETVGFETEGACRDLESFYAPMVGKALYGVPPPGHRQTTQVTMVVHHVECTEIGRLR